ncbi:hypothetical protein FPSE_06352, partial [Fusarium pseudograminearum CS3096]
YIYTISSFSYIALGLYKRFLLGERKKGLYNYNLKKFIS